MFIAVQIYFIKSLKEILVKSLKIGRSTQINVVIWRLELEIYLGFIFFIWRRIHIDMFTDKLIQADLTISRGEN